MYTSNNWRAWAYSETSPNNRVDPSNWRTPATVGRDEDIVATAEIKNELLVQLNDNAGFARSLNTPNRPGKGY